MAATKFIEELAANYRKVKLSRIDRVLLTYVVKLTQRPAQVTNDDINKLRIVGFDDRAIHDICIIAAYFAFVNRVADGLGVELEPRFQKNE